MLKSIKEQIIERAAQIIADHVLKEYKEEINPLPDFNPPIYRPTHLEPPVTVMYGIQQAPYTAMEGVTITQNTIKTKSSK